MNRLGFNVKGKRLVNISEEQIERTFNKQYYVEHVQCYTRSDNSLCIDLEPIQPVMRVLTATSRTTSTAPASTSQPTKDSSSTCPS